MPGALSLQMKHALGINVHEYCVYWVLRSPRGSKVL